MSASSPPADPVPAANRDDARERVAVVVARHRARHNDWMVAFIFGAMYWRQTGAGDVAYEMSVEHSRRLIAELELGSQKRRDDAAAPPAAEPPRLSSTAPPLVKRPPSAVVKRPPSAVVKRPLAAPAIKKAVERRPVKRPTKPVDAIKHSRS